MTKKQIMAAIRKSAAWQGMSQQARARTTVDLEKLNAAQLAVFAKSVGIQASKSRKSRTSAAQRQAAGMYSDMPMDQHRRMSAGKKKSRKLTANQRRSKKIEAAIKAGLMQVQKGGKKSAAQMPGKTARAKAAAFAKLYSGVRLPSSRKSKKKSLKNTFAQVKAQAQAAGQTAHPYFIEKGRTVKIGGGASGPGVIRKIAGTSAKPFNQLSEPQQIAVLAFLDTAKGKKLRGPGAKKKTAQGVAVLHGARISADAQRKSKSQARRISRQSRAAK